MNNFGIFKLLSSLYGYYNRNKEQFPLSSLLNFGGNKNASATEADSPAHKEKNDKTADKSAPRKTEVLPQPAPINRQMLATMTSHDDFVKRVLKNAVTAPCGTPGDAHSVHDGTACTTPRNAQGDTVFNAPHVAQDGTAVTATHDAQPDRTLTEK